MKTFTHFPQKFLNLPVVHKQDLNEPHIAHILTTARDFLGKGRLIARYSGTENVLRVMLEDDQTATLEQAYTYLHTQLQTIFLTN